MPARWNINNQDSADIFGAVHRGLIPVGAGSFSDSDLNRVITTWLETHSNLELKYGGGNFRNNFGRNFRKVVKRYEDWKNSRGKKMT